MCVDDFTATYGEPTNTEWDDEIENDFSELKLLSFMSEAWSRLMFKSQNTVIFLLRKSPKGKTYESISAIFRLESDIYNEMNIKTEQKANK